MQDIASLVERQFIKTDCHEFPIDEIAFRGSMKSIFFNSLSIIIDEIYMSLTTDQNAAFFYIRLNINDVMKTKSQKN